MSKKDTPSLQISINNSDLLSLSLFSRSFCKCSLLGLDHFSSRCFSLSSRLA